MAIDEKLQRRVAGYHNIRIDGISDLLLRANGAAVMDVGCNRGMVGWEFACNGARLIHGCDNYEPGIKFAQELFIDTRNVESQFEVCDLSKGPAALAPFRGQAYDITLTIAVLHKLRRVMDNGLFAELVQHLGKRTKRFFGWRATSEKFHENEEEMALLDRILGSVEMKRIHTSYISRNLGVAAIWGRSY